MFKTYTWGNTVITPINVSKSNFHGNLPKETVWGTLMGRIKPVELYSLNLDFWRSPGSRISSVKPWQCCESTCLVIWRTWRIQKKPESMVTAWMRWMPSGKVFPTQDDAKQNDGKPEKTGWWQTCENIMATDHARSDGEGVAKEEEGENIIMDSTLNLKTIMLVMIYDAR